MKHPLTYLKNHSLSFLKTTETVLTGNDVYKKALSVASNTVLQRKNHFIGIYTSHSADFIISLLGIWQSGNIAVPMGNLPSKEETDKLSQSIGIDFILGDESTRKFIPDNKFSLVTDLYNKEVNTTEDDGFNKKNDAVILFTSGSSGKPKAVPLTFNNLYSNSGFLLSRHPEIKNLRWCASLPFFHVGGLSIITRALFSQSSVFIPEKISSGSVISSMVNGDADLFSIVPATLDTMLKSNRKPAENVKFIFIGGGSSDSRLISEAVKQNFPVYKVYGSTETSSMVTLSGPDILKNEPEASGKPFPGVKITIKKENPQDSSGEIIISAPTVSRGYLNYSNEVFTPDGFVTGDTGYITSSGNLVVTGRKGRKIISGGYNVDPVEIEDALNNINGVTASYVTSLPDNKWGEKIIALVTADKNTDEAYIIRQLEQKLAFYKLPKKIIFTDSIPVTALGKPDKSRIDKIIISAMKEADL